MSITLPNAFCAEAVAARTTTECLPEEEGRIIHDAFVDKSVTIPTTSVSAAITAILAAEEIGKALVIRNCYAEMPASSPKEGVPAGDSESRVVGADRSITGKDHYGVVNVRSWNTVRSNGGRYNNFAFTPGAMWPVVGKRLVISGEPIITLETDPIMADWSVRWNSKDAPEPIFGDPSALADVPSLSGGAIANVSPGTATVVGTEVEVGTGDTLGLQVTFTNADEYALGSDAPAGITLNPTNGLIGGVAPAVGNYTFSVIGRNSNSGIQGVLEITLVVE